MRGESSSRRSARTIDDARAITTSTSTSQFNRRRAHRNHHGRGAERRRTKHLDEIIARGRSLVAAAMARELDDAILMLRTNELDSAPGC